MSESQSDPLRGLFIRYRSRPPSPSVNLSTASGGRVTYRHSRSSPFRSFAWTRTPACREKPSTKADPREGGFEWRRDLGTQVTRGPVEQEGVEEAFTAPPASVSRVDFRSGMTRGRG